MHILALDLGTSSVKAAVLDQKSGELAGREFATKYEIRTPTPDAAEVEAGELWSAISEVAQQAIESGPPVEGIGLACLTPALVLLDKSGEVVAPIRIHSDRRGRPAARRVLAECRDEFLATTGNAPLPGGLSAPAYAALVNDQPKLRDRITHYLHANSWVAWKLTGEVAFDPGNAGFTGLFNTVTDEKWSKRWCEFFGVNPDWLPPVRDGRTTLGTVTAQAAQAWGLPAEVPVKLGVPDTSGGMLAAKLKPGDLLHSVGTTQVLAVVTPRPEPSERRLTRKLGAGPEFVAVAHNPVGGVAFEWIRKLAFQDVSEDDFYQNQIPAAANRKTSVRLDPPFLGGDRHQIEPRLAAFTDLALGTERADLLAAIIHAMRAGHRQALEAIGLDPAAKGRVVLAGGGANVVRQILPEYAHRDTETLDDGAIRGCARLFD